MAQRRARQTERPTAPAGDLLGVPEVCSRIGVSPSGARRLMASGLLGPQVDVSLGGTRAQWRVTAEAVEAFIASRTMATG